MTPTSGAAAELEVEAFATMHDLTHLVEAPNLIPGISRHRKNLDLSLISLDNYTITLKAPLRKSDNSRYLMIHSNNNLRTQFLVKCGIRTLSIEKNYVTL